MKAVFLTAGAAGMYCGSCMHDNALARALQIRGVDCLLQPIYTPIRTDDSSVASHRVFFGGIHVYLLQQMPWLRFVPRPLRGMLDWPPLIRFATRRAGSTDPAKLGDLTISMLQGRHGKQREEVERLVDWLARDVQPDALVLSNLLIGGALPAIREALPNVRLIVILQGDDIFLDHLHETSRAEAIRLCGELGKFVDCFVTNSGFYAEKMSAMLSLDPQRVTVMPLSIDTLPFANPARSRSVSAEAAREPFRIGYMARIAPEKGLHQLVEAFLQIATRPELEHVSLHAAGWLGDHNRDYLRMLTRRIEAAGLSDRFIYHGSPDQRGKVDFLRTLDVLSVPTDYQEPKGLFVLEALAAGVPVVQPDHGAFGELIGSTGGGLLVPPGDPVALSNAIVKLIENSSLRDQLSKEGQAAVHRTHSITAAAERMHQLMSGELPHASQQPGAFVATAVPSGDESGRDHGRK